LAAQCGFECDPASTSITANAYGMMPSPNLMAAALSDACRAAICVWAVRLRSTIRRRGSPERIAMIDWHLGGGSSPGSRWHADGHLLCLRPKSELAAPTYSRRNNLVKQPGARAAGCSSMGSSSAALRQLLAQAHTETPSADLDSRRRSVETWQWCGAQDYVYSYVSYYGYVLAEATMYGFWEEMARQGKIAIRFAPPFAVSSALPRRPEEAVRLYKEPADTSIPTVCMSTVLCSPPGLCERGDTALKMARRSRQPLIARKSRIAVGEFACILKMAMCWWARPRKSPPNCASSPLNQCRQPHAAAGSSAT